MNAATLTKDETIRLLQAEIERLREELTECERVGGKFMEEIERLRDAVKFLNSFRPDAEFAKRDAEIERLHAAQTELVTALHDIASHFENALYTFRDDTEAKKKAEGDIAHAMEIAARHNRNGQGVLSNA